MSDEAKRFTVKICDEHWDDIKQEIERIGMGGFIATTEDQLNACVDAETEQEAFEPLLDAVCAITERYINDLMEQNLEPTHNACPLCEVERGGTEEGMAQDWIEGSVNDQYQAASKLGLLTKH